MVPTLGGGGYLCKIVQYMGHYVSFFVDRAYERIKEFCGKQVKGNNVLDPDKYFALICQSANPSTIESIKSDLMNICHYSSDDWFSWYEEVNYDIVVDGVNFGKGSTISTLGWLLDPMRLRCFSSIGRYVSVNAQTCIVRPSHHLGLSTSWNVPYTDEERKNFSAANRIKIGNDVYIGANTFLNASKVRVIGDGAVIGAGAVVLGDIPPYAVAVGVPARVKKYRFTPEEIDTLEKVRWWDWDDETLKRNSFMFARPEEFFKVFK